MTATQPATHCTALHTYMGKSFSDDVFSGLAIDTKQASQADMLSAFTPSTNYLY